MTTQQREKSILDQIDRLVDDNTLFRGLLDEALECLEASHPPKGVAIDQICRRIRKALGK